MILLVISNLLQIYFVLIFKDLRWLTFYFETGF